MKNFTQLLPGRDGSNAKTNNTSGHAYAFPLILTLLLTLGVGEMKADTSWTVAGDNTSVLGTSWDPSNTANDMIQSGSNWFLIKHVTFASNGTINFKACKDHAWGTSYGAGSSNASIGYTAGTKDIIFVTNATDWAWGMETNYWEVVGDNATLFTNTWNLGQDANKMTYSAGSYTKTYSNVPLNCGTTIQWKVAAGKNWDYSFPNANQTLKIHADGTYDITFSFNISTFEATATATPTSDKYFVKGESPLSWNNCEGTEMTAGSDYTSTTYYYLQVNGSREFKIMEQYDDWDNTASYEKNYTKVDNHVMRTDIDLTLKAGSGNNIVMPSAGYIIYYPGTQKICAATSLTNLGKPYTITYKDQGGGAFSGTQTSAPTTHTYGTATTLKIPTKANYDFGGWFTVSDCASGAVGNTSSASLAADGYEDDIILYAKWTPKTYTITYKDQGNVAYSGSNEASLPSSYTYGTGIASLTEGVKSGYAFDGWFDNSSCTGSAITSISSSATGAKTFYAKWTENPGGTVTLVAGTGGQVSKDNSSWGANAAITGIKSATPLTIYARPTTGYTFNTWTKTSGSGTVTAATATGTFTPVADADATVTASFTERMSSLTTSNHYDAGNPSYAAPTVSGSATNVGYVTTRTITAAAAGTGYTFAGWTLTNCTRTDGGAATATSITIRSNGDGAAATVVANYEEVLTQSTWIIKGGTAISGSNWATEVAMSKASGASTSDIVYATINISATNTGDSNGAYKFKVVKKSPDTYFGLDADGQYYLMRGESGTEKTLNTENADIELRADVTGNYVFKVDYSNPSSPKLTVTWPTAVYLSSDNESAYADGSVTLTADGANLPSGSKTIEYEFFKGNNTDPANKIGSTQTFNSITATSHSTTQSVSPEFSTSDYAASQVYTVKMTVNGGTPYTNTITIYRKWDIYVHDVVSWGGLRLYMWGGTTGDNSWPGTACSVLSGNWYTVTLSSKYYSGFLLNKSSDENIKTNDHHTSAAAAGDKNDHDELCSYFEEGSYYYIHSYEWESNTYYELNPLDMSAPTVEMQDGESQSLAINTTELFLTGLVTGYGGDGLSARDMAECGFIINGTEYPVSSSCTAEDSGFFWGYVGGLTPGTTYTVSAYAKNIMGRGVSANTASVATRAAGTTTIKVRTGVSDPVPNIYAWTWDEVCDHSTLQNAAWPGAAMTLSITGTTYKWYTYELSNEYNEFKISESGSNETNNFNNPFESTCYWYHSSEATQGDRMGSMTCPYVTPQLMIEENAGEEDFTYLEMSTSPTISKTVSLAAKSTYLFKIVYNAEWYGKASVNLSRAENTVSGISAAIEDNMAITTDAAGDYTFTFSTPGTVTVTYPTAYTVTFGYGTGGTTVTASATTAGGALTSGDYVAAGDEVTFTQTPATGYTFKGWYTTADGNTTVTTMGESDNELNDIAADATVYAQYTPNNYTVTFDATTNGGTCGTPSKSVTFDAAYGDLPEATKDAKVFAGWYTTSSGAGTQVTAETIVSNAANHTIYARFEDTYSVTIQYKSGDVTLKPNGSTTASATALAPEITAPEFLGYTFTGWTGTSATFDDASSATTTVNVTAATTITANYSAIPTVYFKNNLGWEHVYVTFDNTWSSDAPCNNGKPYYEMTQMGESDIFYCVIPGDVVSSWKWNISFDNHGFSASENVGTFSGGFNTGEFIGRGDFASEATMFIPYNGDKEGRNGGTYYRTGCWMKYNSTDPGYKVYANTWKEGSGGVAVDGTPVLLTADIAGGYEFKATVNFPTPDYTYGFMLKKEATSNTNDLWYTNTSDIYASTTTLPWDFTAEGASENGTRCGLHTEATGNYVITVSFATGKPMVNVTYPVSTNDWRLVYKDRATWSNGVHTAAWQHPSRVIKAKADAEDIVSFYVSKADGANATIELQKCTAIDPGTGAQTWVKQSDVDLSAITSTGIYNFKVTQDGEGDATAAYDGSYSGNFYIRTDASDGGWSNYKTSGTNTMTYSEYAEDNHDFTHYFMRYVTTGTNIKFCIANDYSECISDTIVGDTYTGEYIAVYGNVRFMWDHRTNKVSRAYISGSSNVSDRFLVLEGDAKMFNEAGTALTTAAGGKVENLNEYEMNFTDDQNWIYEATVKAQPGARIKLTAKYNNKIQYFYGAEGARSDATTEPLLGGSDANQYEIRVVYDFKTNRLMKAFIPEGDITTDLAINADLMIIREHQEDAQQINFTVSGALSDVKTVYGAMKFNKWTVNGKEKDGGHATTTDSRYKRDLFYISFPFDVKLSDVFGFGTYGTHWIIEYYDGKGRAKNGFWADSDSYWKFVLPSQRSSFTLKAFEGYILALDLDEMTESSSIWNNGVQDVYVYFPSSGDIGNIAATNRLVEIDQEGYECTIGPRFEGGDDRRVKDSYWHVIGVPSFANYSSALKPTSGGSTIDWSDDDGTIDWSTPSLPYLYEWDPDDNSLSVTRSATFSFKATYSYMVQYAGASIYWSAVNATPSSVVARKNDNQPTSAEFRLELQQTGKAIDQTFVRLTDEVNVTTGFDFNYDLSKEMNANKANIFTMITTAMDDGNTVTESAANCLPLSEQTTIVPVGVKIAANDDYTFSIPDGANGVGVTLIDNLTGTRTNLSAVDYTVSLEAGTYDERFTLEISPIQYLPTELEQSDINNQMSDVRKVLIDGLLYIVHDNKMYDARGARVE